MRNDQLVFYTKFASLITGAIGATIGLLGFKLMIDVLPYFAIPKSLKDSINQLVWIEGEVESDKGFKVSFI
jgi:hypothetical protein